MRDADSHVYLHDANFNVTALLEDDATVVERYAYTPYGEVTVLDADFSADGDEKVTSTTNTCILGKCCGQKAVGGGQFLNIHN